MIITRTLAIKDLNKFNSELNAANDKVVISILYGVDDLKITVSDTWDSSDDVALDNFIANFVDIDPDDKVPRIIDLAKAEAKTKHFHNILYKTELTARLQKESIVVQGEMRKVTYYRNMQYEMQQGVMVRVYDTPILKVESSWLRDAAGFAIAKLPTKRTYFNRDGTENADFKMMGDPYYYEDFEIIVEGKKRRGLLVNSIQLKALSYITQVLTPLGYNNEACQLRARSFLDLYEELFSKFEKSSSSDNDPASQNFLKKNIIIALEDNSPTGFNKDHNEWLDGTPALLGGMQTIRQWLISEFDI